MRFTQSLILSSVLFMTIATAVQAQTAAQSADLAARRASLNALLEEQWQYTLKDSAGVRDHHRRPPL